MTDKPKGSKPQAKQSDLSQENKKKSGVIAAAKKVLRDAKKDKS